MKLLSTILPAALALGVFLPSPPHTSAAPPPFTATITRASDGDTLMVQRGNSQPIKIRLRYVDAPELAHNRRQTDQPHGREAVGYVETWKGREVTVTPHQRDRYGRMVAEIRKCDNGACVDLGASLVHNGLAWVDERYHPPKTLLTHQAEARKEKRGLWADDAPVNPQDWRRRSREEARRK